MYKLIALDLDGTLLGSDKVISQQNQDAIAKARAAGVTVVLASAARCKACSTSLSF
ncbi:predicted hydrolase [Vibrio astriarenae]|nr:predicted hydrolase [Vibrio sp. C7]